MKMSAILGFTLVLICVNHAVASPGSFSAEELEVAQFWADMGPTLSNQGIEAYARRYHEKFSHWDIQNSGRMSSKESAIRYWSRFHESGNRITCTHVEPVTITLRDDSASARLIYEQTDSLADGTVRTGIWRMVALFERNGETWQVLETNMVDFSEPEDIDPSQKYTPQCAES